MHIDKQERLVRIYPTRDDIKSIDVMPDPLMRPPVKITIPTLCFRASEGAAIVESVETAIREAEQMLTRLQAQAPQ